MIFLKTSGACEYTNMCEVYSIQEFKEKIRIGVISSNPNYKAEIMINGELVDDIQFDFETISNPEGDILLLFRFPNGGIIDDKGLQFLGRVKIVWGLK